jgi:signal transduction histidine kinase
LISAQEGANRENGPTNLDTVIRECLKDFVAQFSAHDIRLHFEHGNPAPVVNVDVPELRLIIDSVISNSLEAMPNGGELAIHRYLDEHNMARIVIADTGPGIPDEIRSRIFEPFVTGKEKGLGIGLALARRGIERMGGSLEFIDKSGKGATAILTLPAEVAH